jgi:hypothetical protein
MRKPCGENGSLKLKFLKAISLQPFKNIWLTKINYLFLSREKSNIGIAPTCQTGF